MWAVHVDPSEDITMTSTAAEATFERLFRAYRAHHTDVTLAMFQQRLLNGVIVWQDLQLGDLQHFLNASPQLDSKNPIKTRLIQRMLEDLLRATLHDPLTDLFNRRYFDRRLSQELERSRRERKPCSVLLIDLDDFKHINDTLGHDAGDQVLCCAARAMERSLRKTDEATARYGGEEFSVLLPDTGLRDALSIAHRIRAQIASDGKACLKNKAQTLLVTASVGIALWHPQRPLLMEELLKEADLALYEAKESGKNAVRYLPALKPLVTESGVTSDEREALLG